MVDELSVADLEALGLTAPVSRAKHTYRTPMSQEFDLIDPFAIKIGNRHRQGTDQKKDHQLRELLRNLGLQHPPVVDRDLTLISGYRRVKECRILAKEDQEQWRLIPVHYADQLDDDERLALELEENLAREDFSWQERELAFFALTEVYRRKGWSLTCVADWIGYDKATVTNRRKMAQELKVGNPEVLAARSAREAGRIIDRQKQDIRARAADELRVDLGTQPRAQIITADFNLWAPTYEGPRFQVLHVDFPYAAQAHNYGQGSMPVHGAYDDSPETAKRLYDTLSNNLCRLVHDQAWMFFWFQTRQNADGTIYKMLSRDWDVCPTPMIWDKAGAGAGGDIDHDPRHVYETAFLCSRGSPVLIQQRHDLFRAPIVPERHANEKAAEMLKHFFRNGSG